MIFKNSCIGNFSLLICSDYLAPDIKTELLNSALDFLFIPSFHRKSEQYHDRMHIDCDNSGQGIYLVYANNNMLPLGDGRSAFFGLMHDTFRHQFLGRVTDGKPITKIVELDNSADSIILKVDTHNKKPTLGKTVFSRPNVVIVDALENKKTVVSEPTIDKKISIKKLKDDLKNQILILIYLRIYLLF